VAIKTVCDLIE